MDVLMLSCHKTTQQIFRQLVLHRVKEVQHKNRPCVELPDAIIVCFACMGSKVEIGPLRGSVSVVSQCVLAAVKKTSITRALRFEFGQRINEVQVVCLRNVEDQLKRIVNQNTVSLKDFDNLARRWFLDQTSQDLFQHLASLIFE